MVNIAHDSIEKYVLGLMNDSDGLSHLESLLAKFEPESFMETYETSTSEVEETRPRTPLAVDVISIEVTNDSYEGEAHTTLVEPIPPIGFQSSTDDVLEIRSSEVNEIEMPSANMGVLEENPSEMEFIDNMSLGEFEKYLENLDGLSLTSSFVDTREFDEDFEDLLKELESTFSVESWKKIPRDKNKIGTLEFINDEECGSFEDHFSLPSLCESDTVSTYTPPNLHIMDYFSIPGSRMWLTYDKKGELI